MKKMTINNESYPSLTSNHTRWARLDFKNGLIERACMCTECQCEQVFTVEYDYTRSKDISVDRFVVYDQNMLDVTDRLTVRDYDKLKTEIEDWISCQDVWIDEDEQERINRQENYHYE